MAKDAAAHEETTGLDTCFKVLSGIQDQIRFADAKAAFMLGVNTLMFGFVTCTISTLKRHLAADPVPVAAWFSLGAMIAYSICAIVAVGFLIYAVMSRFGKLAPKSRVFFGHIALQFGKDYGKYVTEIRAMSNQDWVNEVGTQ